MVLGTGLRTIKVITVPPKEVKGPESHRPGQRKVTGTECWLKSVSTGPVGT